MALNVATLTSRMLGAALPILKKDAQDAGWFAQLEFTKIAQTIAAIGEQVAARQINEQQAGLLLAMQTGASRNVLLALRGLTLLAVEEGINAALNAVKSAVNTAVGFVLIA